jgi:hypothetical protein
VKRWRAGDHIERWVGSGLLVAERQFRKPDGRDNPFGTIPNMERNWCCPEFQEHASTAGKRSFRVALVWRGRRPFSCYLEFRKPDMKPLEPSEGGIEIKFCPWCGSNLGERYAPGQ